METKETVNETNLPEKGAQGDSDQVVNNDTAQGQPNANPEDSKLLIKDNDSVEDETLQEVKESLNSQEKKADDTKGGSDKEDYSGLDRASLLKKLDTLVSTLGVEEIKDAVEEIKAVFYKRYKIDVAEARKKFMDDGSVAEDFKFADTASEDTFKVLYGKYKVKRAELNSKLEKERTDNLKSKNQIIEEINNLINNEESINKTFNEFKELQQQWRDVGLVPQSAVKNLWENYNHTVEKFYDFININKELRDLDFKKNLELKIELCEKAEALMLEEQITKAFKTLQEYHSQWREVGPVPNDQREAMWDRFKVATTLINKKHQDYFEELKGQQVNNLEKKTALCESVEAIVAEKIEKHKAWEDKSKELIDIQKLWRTIGFAPKKDNNKVYQRFKTACDEFFTLKRDYYKAAKEVQMGNLQLKLDLCVKAEAMSESSEWKKTTDDYIKLQKLWKDVGIVPKKHSETVWKRFRAACDLFFNKKAEFYNTIDSRQEDNLKLKLELLEKVKLFTKGDNDKDSLKLLMDIQKEWTKIGYVPLDKKEEIQKQFKDVLNEKFDELKIDIEERNKLNFKTKIDSWVGAKSNNKLYSERSKLSAKIKELQNEITLYENNIGFFSASKNSEGLIADITRKIDKAKEYMKTLQQKVRLLDKAEREM